MASKQNISSKDCIYLANDIIVERNVLIPRLTTIKDINCGLFCLIFENIFNIDCSLFSPKNKCEEIDVISRLLSILSNDLIGISLEHIKPIDIVDRNVNTVYDFLEIIYTFIKYIPKQIETNRKTANNCEKENNYHSIKRTFHSKAIQTNSNENKLIGNKNVGFNYTKNENSSKSCSSSSSSSTHWPQWTLREGQDVLKSGLEHNSDNGLDWNSCGERNKCDSDQQLKTRSKAIQTEMGSKPQKEVLPKETTFDEFKRVQTDNFVTELGHRLLEALKLKEMSQTIENKINKYYGDVSAQTPTKSKPKQSLVLRSGRKNVIRNKKSPLIGRKPNSSKPMNVRQNVEVLGLDDLIKAYPEISRNTIKSLKDQEKHQQKMVQSLHKEVVLNEAKVKSHLNSAIETQNKRSLTIKKDIKHLKSLTETKSAKLEKLKENAAKRDSRLERALIHKTIQSYHKDMVSKYKRLQSIEENIVFKEYEKQHKAQQQNMDEFRKRVQQNHSMQMNRQKQMLEAFETIYRNKYEMLSQNLNKEEQRLKSQISGQTHYLRSMKNDYKKRFEADFRNLFNDKP